MTTHQTDSTATVRQRPSVVFDALRTALERPEEEIRAQATQQGSPEKPSDVAVAMRLANEAVATAAKAADTELRKVRELLQQSEARARAAEERAQAAEWRALEWQKLLVKIRDQIVEEMPERRAA